MYVKVTLKLKPGAHSPERDFLVEINSQETMNAFLRHLKRILAAGKIEDFATSEPMVSVSFREFELDWLQP